MKNHKSGPYIKFIRLIHLIEISDTSHYIHYIKLNYIIIIIYRLGIGSVFLVCQSSGSRTDPVRSHNEWLEPETWVLTFVSNLIIKGSLLRNFGYDLRCTVQSASQSKDSYRVRHHYHILIFNIISNHITSVVLVISINGVKTCKVHGANTVYFHQYNGTKEFLSFNL